jgi:hypothetical protein
METDLRCNRLTCRKALTDKAVVVRAFFSIEKTPFLNQISDNMCVLYP